MPSLRFFSILVYVGLSIATLHGQLGRFNYKVPPNSTCQIDLAPSVPDLNGTDYINNTRSAQLPHGNTYRYVHYPPFQGKPTLLFLHGFPSTSFDFRRQFAFFSEKGYGIIAPDLLGYGGSSKPSSLDSYRLKFMAQDLADLLDCIGATKIISVGHDWGSLMNSRFITYHGDRLIATVFLDIGYFAPPLSIGPGTAKALNTMTSLTLGYPIFGYWFFFNDTSAPALLNSHPHSISTLLYASDPKLQSKNFCDPVALRSWLSANRTAPPSPWLPANELHTFETITSTNGGYDASLNWYRAIVQNINTVDENVIPKAKQQITVPTLLITAQNDPVGLPQMASGMTRSGVANGAGFVIKSVDAGHFLMVEKSEETNRFIYEFIKNIN